MHGKHLAGIACRKPCQADVHTNYAPRVCSAVQSSLTLCDLMDCSLPYSSVHGILQARILEWVAMPSCRGSSQPKDRT